jgi:hypothetical protein
LAATVRHHPDDPEAIQAAKDRLVLANVRALLADTAKEDKDHA